MADTRVQLEVEDWVREHWLSKRLERPLHRNRVGLTSGGVFDFDAVSEDKKIVACISTSGGKTASGKLAVGKLLKLRSDMLFLLLAKEVDRRLLVLTEPDAFDLCQKEKAGGRVPPEIEILLAEISAELRARLLEARRRCSEEMSSANGG